MNDSIEHNEELERLRRAFLHTFATNRMIAYELTRRALGLPRVLPVKYLGQNKMFNKAMGTKHKSRLTPLEVTYGTPEPDPIRNPEVTQEQQLKKLKDDTQAFLDSLKRQQAP